MSKINILFGENKIVDLVLFFFSNTFSPRILIIVDW